jgi:tRNA threonylcarbamoyladenosine biosynthesis protein TsaB
MWITDGRHTVELTPAIEAMLAQVEVDFAALTLLAIAQGPGSFNGLRVGYSVAMGLAAALNLPLIAIPTLSIVAAAQPAFSGQLIAVAQAGRGRVVAQTFHWVDEAWHGQPDTAIVAWAALLGQVAASPLTSLISGEIDAEGLAAIRSAQAQGVPVQISSPAASLRRAGFLAELAWQRWHHGEVTDASGGTPNYLHQPGVPHP